LPGIGRGLSTAHRRARRLVALRAGCRAGGPVRLTRCSPCRNDPDALPLIGDPRPTGGDGVMCGLVIRTFLSYIGKREREAVRQEVAEGGSRDHRGPRQGRPRPGPFRRPADDDPGSRRYRLWTPVPAPDLQATGV
jgi:hypothetical protein